MAKIIANEIRPGNVLEYNGKLCKVAKIMHTQPGKGGAYVQVEMSDIINGTKFNERFRSSENVEKARLDTKDFQYLFGDGSMITLMDLESYEQINVPVDIVGDAAPFLQDGMTVSVEMHEEKPIQAYLPETVTLEIVEADAVVKGQTASSSYKPAVLENGVRVMVPPFIGSGTKVVVRTADSSYVERAK